MDLSLCCDVLFSCLCIDLTTFILTIMKAFFFPAIFTMFKFYKVLKLKLYMS